jgi:hemoglobin
LTGSWSIHVLNANPRVDDAHHRVSAAGFKYFVTEMLCEAAGGPQRYSGRPMGDSHRHLMITDQEWLGFMDDLQQTLDKFEVPQPEQDEIKAIVESTREAIVVAPIPPPAEERTIKLPSAELCCAAIFPVER